MKAIRAVVAAAALAAMPVAAQRSWADVEIKVTKVTETTYVLAGAGGNIGLSVGADAAFLVDDQFAPLTDKINAAIAKITAKPVRFVLNTHWHGDHTGGNESYGKAGALIVAHENVRKRMSSEQFIEFTRSTVKASPKEALPVVTFAGAVSFHLNGEEIRAIHAPRAHTDGDTIVHFVGSDVVHMGDIFWNGQYPFVDGSSGGSMQGMVDACDQVLALAGDKTRIIAGHGPPLSDKRGLEQYRDMLATIHGRIRRMVDEGRKLEEITASGVTRDFDEKWGKGFVKPEKFAEMIAMGILKNR